MPAPATAALLLATALSSCATDTTGCPPVKDYTKAEQAAACAELKAMCPSMPQAAGCGDVRRYCPALRLPALIDDYKLLRDAVRACRPQ